MAAETKFAECDQCGMEFSYSCRCEAVCPCGYWMDQGTSGDCDCDECRRWHGNHDDAETGSDDAE